MDIKEAIAFVKAAGYTVTKKAEKKLRTVGPTFAASWSDGVVTRMSIHTHDEKPDVQRAVRVSKAAYDSRTKGLGFAKLQAGHFERAGLILSRYEAKELARHL